MTDPASDCPPATLSERYPVWNVLRGFRIAVHIPHVLLASLAVLILAAGQQGVGELPFAPKDRSVSWPWQATRPSAGLPWKAVEPELVSSAWQMLTLPYRSVVEPALQLLSFGNTLSQAAYAWTQLLWALLVWGYFGGAISRMAAVNFAADRSVGLKTATRYARRRFLSFFSAPLLPIAGLLCLWLLLTVGGLIGCIPTVGPYLVGIFWLIAIAVGLVAALIAIGLFAGWPLMSPTIATEDSDAFDGFSRSFSYVFSRPRQGIGFLLVSAVYGTVCVAFVTMLCALVVYLTAWGISYGMGTNEVHVMTTGSSIPPVGATVENYGKALEAVPDGARTITAFWLNVLTIVVQGFAVSLFWTLATVVYFLLRQSDDATSLDEVFLTEADEPDDLLPLVGVATSEQPVIERPLGKDSGPSDESANDDSALPPTSDDPS